MENSFGDYLIEVDGNHAIIRRKDGKAANPSWYELQYMKNIAFGGDAFAIEVFPSNRSLVDGQNQRHLWKVEKNKIPDLSDGMNVQINENENGISYDQAACAICVYSKNLKTIKSYAQADVIEN